MKDSFGLQSPRRLAIIFFLIISIVWSVESFFHSNILNERDFLTEFFYPTTHEIWMRYLIISSMVIAVYTWKSYRIGREAEKKIKAQNLFLQDVIESIPNPFYVINARDYTIQLANYASSKFGDPSKTTCHALTHNFNKPCSEKRHTCPLEDVKISKKPVVMEHVHTDNEGNKSQHEVHGYPILDERGNVIKMIEFSLDITRRKEDEKKLKEYTIELENSNRIKDLFSDIISHDLLNPIGIARSSAEILLDEDENNAELNIIFKNIDRTVDLIENATIISRLESSKVMDKADLELKSVIEKAISDLSPLFKNHGMEISNNITNNLNVNANPMIEHVFINLFSNALKYASEGKKLIIDARELEGKVEISVTDFGPGIQDKDKDEIFTRFERKYRGPVKGTGLGLAIVKRLADLHGGKVWVEDNPGGGARFVVEIPRT